MKRKLTKKEYVWLSVFNNAVIQGTEISALRIADSALQSFKSRFPKKTKIKNGENSSKEV